MPHHRPHLPEFLLTYFKDRELNELYLSVFLKVLGQSLITIFIPIYFIILGYSIFDISLFYLIYFITITITMPFGMWSNSKIGIKKTLTLGTFVLIFYYYLLGFLETGLSYHLIAVVFGISSGFYFAAFHIDFAKSANKGREGKELSCLRIIVVIVGVLGPLIGSLLISAFSFNFMFKFVSIVLFLSVIPLFFSKDFSIRYKKFSPKRILKADSKEKGIAYQASAMVGIAQIYFWPLFIYLTLKSVVSLGVIVSTSSLLTIFIIAYIGKLTDRDKNSVLKLGVLSTAPSWIIRIFLLSPIGMFFINFYSFITQTLIDLPFNKMTYAKAKRSKHIANYFLFREFNLMKGRILILAIALATQSIVWVFIATFFATFLYLIVLKKSKKR